MQRTTSFEQLADTWPTGTAGYDTPWAHEDLVAAHQPLVHALAARALDGRPGSDVAVPAVVRDTVSRARFASGALPAPESFRPWIVAIAVASTLAHAAAGHGHPVPPVAPGSDAEALRWLDIEDSVMAALWSLEEEGCMSRYETAAALNWSPDDTAIRMESVRVRLDVARSVTAALARTPRCPGLHQQAAAWDGRPGAAWRDELARHTAHCGHCLMGVGAAVPADLSAAPTETFAVVPDLPVSSAATEHEVAAAPAGRRTTRATRRRRRQADERTRRRAVMAAGIAVVAVTGGAFSLNAGRDRGELLEVNRAAAPGLDLPLANEPETLTASPSTASAPPSASAPASAPASPSAPAAAPTRVPAQVTSMPTKAPRPTATKPAPPRTTAPAGGSGTTAPATPKPTASTGGTDAGPGGGPQHDTGQSSAADQVIALVNSERAKAGCGPLSANATLTRAAQGHSDDMAARNFFDHTDPDGDGPGERVTAAGYPWSTYGENIAKGQSTPEQVMESWMNSPGHRANILNCDFKEIGVGIHDDGGPYWTQVFGAR
ncbi:MULTISPECIES: CAP domain-containing protein [Streptomyces]|uniref:CAP domain-containing protein n=1 Tax=Streptomyces TaxID=1883 RepID=UPI0021AB524C|nr:CAP domain-containing protein [Streptomyces lateritius]